MTQYPKLYEIMGYDPEQPLVSVAEMMRINEEISSCEPPSDFMTHLPLTARMGRYYLIEQLKEYAETANEVYWYILYSNAAAASHNLRRVQLQDGEFKDIEERFKEEPASVLEHLDPRSIDCLFGMTLGFLLLQRESPEVFDAISQADIDAFTQKLQPLISRRSPDPEADSIISLFASTFSRDSEEYMLFTDRAEGGMRLGFGGVLLIAEETRTRIKRELVADATN